MKLQVSEIVERKHKILVLKPEYGKNLKEHLKDPDFKKKVISDMKRAGLDFSIGSKDTNTADIIDSFFEKKGTRK